MKYSTLIKTKIGSIAVAIAIIPLLQACQNNNETVNISTMSAGLLDANKATSAKEMPVHPGVQRSLEEYVLDHISYPPAAMINRIEGTIYVRFDIDDNGNLSDVSVIGRRIGYGLEEEAIRVVNGIPEWIIEEVKGKQSKRILPIVYRISDEENSLKI